MPEAFAVLLILVVSLGTYVFGRAQFREPVPVPAGDRATLLQQIAWLEERLDRARAENWDESMHARISRQLAECRARLAGNGSG